MQIIETFPAPGTKAGRLFWLPEYVRLSKGVYDTYRNTGELSEATRHVSNCAARWGVTKRVAEAILTGEGTYDMTDEIVTVTRTLNEE
jgi:hypothetical protein